jgi:aminoglycoside phosphotransferase (APT) family kinase protein
MNVGTSGSRLAAGGAADDGRVVADLQARLRLANADTEVLALEPFGDGHSGFTYRVQLSRGGETSWLVLRLSPPGARSAGPADVGRQGAIMSALHGAGVAVPAILDFDSEAVIDGRSFALMELIDGVGWFDAAQRLPHLLLAERAVEALKTVQDVAPGRVLPGELRRSASEELQRWVELSERAGDELRSPIAQLADVLRPSAPGPTRAVLVHGDYHYGNLIFRGTEIAAILDWEIATVGERLVDLAGLVVASMRSRYAPDPNPTGTAEVALESVCDSYGVDPESLRWWVAETCLKYAAILGYNRMLHRRGKRIDPVYDQLDRTIAGLLADGLAVAEHGYGAVASLAGG